jgi:hypothetical protein
MNRNPETLFHAFDRGVISRRQLLQALGIAVALKPAAAIAQGQCGGANKGTPGCDTTPAKLPFEPTGWNTVLLDHFSCQCVDYAKEAAYYQALMNWKIRSDDGKQAVLDIGDWGGLILRNGYVAPPPLPAAATTAPPAGANPGAGRGGQGGPPRAPRNAAFDGMAWGIDKWDAKKVEAELKARGLSPSPRITATSRASTSRIRTASICGSPTASKQSPQGAASGKTSRPRRSNRRTGRRVARSHLVRSHELQGDRGVLPRAARLEARRRRGQPEHDGHRRRRRRHRRRGNADRPGRSPRRRASMGHISFGIDKFDPDAVKAELTKRGLNAREDTGGRGDIHTAPYKSYHTTTPNGFDLQISATTKGDAETTEARNTL